MTLAADQLDWPWLAPIGQSSAAVDLVVAMTSSTPPGKFALYPSPQATVQKYINKLDIDTNMHTVTLLLYLVQTLHKQQAHVYRKRFCNVK